MATNPNAVVIFHASDIVLRADTDALYLTEPEAYSRASGYIFLGNITSKCTRERLNGHININL